MDTSIEATALVNRHISAQLASGAGPAKTAAIAPPDGEFLKHLSAGKSDWEIGAMLTLSEMEVKRHVARAMGKLGVPTRTQAVVRAVMSDQIVP